MFVNLIYKAPEEKRSKITKTLLKQNNKGDEKTKVV